MKKQRIFYVYEALSEIITSNYFNQLDKVSTPLYFTYDGWRLITKIFYVGKVSLSGNDDLLKKLHDQDHINNVDNYFYKVWENCSIEICCKQNHLPVLVLCEKGSQLPECLQDIDSTNDAQ